VGSHVREVPGAETEPAEHNRAVSSAADWNDLPGETSVSETIRKPPLVEAQNAIGKQKNTAKNDFQYGGRAPS